MKKLDKDFGGRIYYKMKLIGEFEERLYHLFLEGKIPGTIHLYAGQEAVAVGVCENLTKEDYITSTHRPHGHAIAKGVSIKSMMAELYGKTEGCCKGYGGSMHVGDIKVGAVPAVAIVGGGIPISVGIGLSYKLRKKKNVAACFFGDGATNEGAFHEGLNISAIWNLPVIFVCENNLYGASTHISKVCKLKNLAERASAYGMEGVIADGNDVIDVYEKSRKAVEKARNGEGPTLIECKTYRKGGHSRGDACNYRDKEEEKRWLARNPVNILKERLIKEKIFSEEEIQNIEKRVNREIENAVEYISSCTDHKPEDALKYVYYEGE
ncbi:MAG: thiamine pyrophosphate-dependent dehydrogenase E1 component subunit alpha [Candidatus Omnitrophota bacterium]